MVCEFPQVLDHLTGNDASFEFVTSATLPTMQLHYYYHVEVKSQAAIFVMTKCKTKKGTQIVDQFYEGAEAKGEKTKTLFKDLMQIKVVNLYKDPTKDQMI